MAVAQSRGSVARKRTPSGDVVWTVMGGKRPLDLTIPATTSTSGIDLERLLKVRRVVPRGPELAPPAATDCASLQHWPTATAASRQSRLGCRLVWNYCRAMAMRTA